MSIDSFLAGWKRLDTVVKLGLFVFIGSFTLIWVGMCLTRPDRSIPPYSVGSQEGTTVAVHVPPWTSDTEIAALLRRFQKVAREGRDFGRMKIQPTTPGDPAGRYRRMTVYVFADDRWAEPEVLHRYLAAAGSRDPAELAFREEFEKTVRGYYRLEDVEEEGRLGRIDGALRGGNAANTAADPGLLFKGPVADALRAPVTPAGDPAASPLSPF